MAAVDNVEHQQQGMYLTRKRDRRHYGYQSYFINPGVFYNILNVPFIHTMYMARTEYWTKHRRKYLEHTYPSFFMKLERIPTGRWECEDHNTSATWTCD